MRPLMSSSASNNSPPEEFDEFAEDYDGALNQGLKFTGESKDYFAKGRARWTAKRLREFGVGEVGSCLDFGCGTGSATPHLYETFNGVKVTGIDPSRESIELAREEHGGDRTDFCINSEFDRQGEIDLGYCNGVFHHILPDERDEAMSTVFDSLKPGGVFALWENNP
ncbi:MAG: class I SAM-dependent methyltransferase [Verrucomicrobiales bacterium]|nr:class I SAM-dependent methyltransferase [Verrucomicrobiales bacterium]